MVVAEPKGEKFGSIGSSRKAYTRLAVGVTLSVPVQVKGGGSLVVIVPLGPPVIVIVGEVGSIVRIALFEEVFKLAFIVGVTVAFGVPV